MIQGVGPYVYWMFNYSIWFLVKAHWGLEFAKRYNMFGLNNYTEGDFTFNNPCESNIQSFFRDF